MSAQASIRARILGCSSNRNRRQTVGIVAASIMMIAPSAAWGEGRIQLRNSYFRACAVSRAFQSWSRVLSQGQRTSRGGRPPTPASEAGASGEFLE